VKKAEYVELITMIESFFPGRFKNDEMTGKTWWEILKEYDFDFCKKNLIKYVQVGEWPPTIANLIAGHKDTSRPYADSLAQTLDKPRNIADTIADIERRTGMKVKL
jgi:hypothetical protein